MLPAEDLSLVGLLEAGGVVQLASQLLSPQQHYDWGLRALKTCLGVAGRLLHEQRKQAQPGAAGPPSMTNSEMQLVLRAVRLATLPKLTFDDNVR